MKKLLIVCLMFSLFLTGCQTVNSILTTKEQYFFIPAGAKIEAVIIKGQRAQEVIVDHDMWCINASYLVELQEAANAETLEDIR